jgi:hypothetical protein
VGEFFTSFEDAWVAFVDRVEPLESFWDEFPDEPDFVAEGWLIVPPPEIKRAALGVQAALELPGLRIVPHHFLHVWLRGAYGPDLDELLGLAPFELRLPRLTCFHTAVVAEVESEELAAIEAPAVFLPHLSLAYVELPVDPAPIRDGLAPRRNTNLGSFVVEELLHVRVPAAKSTVLEPWEVVERVPLRR